MELQNRLKLYVLLLLTNCTSLNLDITSYYNVTHCKVTKVIDGDTIYCNNNKIRLAFIDAPEKNEKGYTEAKNKLNLLTGSNVTLRIFKIKDKYNRLVGEVYYNGININTMLVDLKLATPYEPVVYNKTIKKYFYKKYLEKDKIRSIINNLNDISK